MTTSAGFMYNTASMVTCSGSLATTNCELRQVRKEATVTVTSGAGVWLEQVTALIFFPESHFVQACIRACVMAF